MLDMDGLEEEAVDADGWFYALDFNFLKWVLPPGERGERGRVQERVEDGGARARRGAGWGPGDPSGAAWGKGWGRGEGGEGGRQE